MTQTTARHRERPRLPEFATGCTADLNTARIDQLRLVFPNYRIRYSSYGALRAYVLALNNSGLFVADDLRRRMVLNIRPGWLFSGKLSFLAANTAGSGQCRVELSLHLNPTRYCAHRGAPLSGQSTLFLRELLHADPTNFALASRYALDGHDNVIPLHEWSRYGPFAPHAQTYVDMVLDLIEGVFDEFTDGDTSPADGEPLGDRDIVFEPDRSGWRIDHVEVYWEYSAENATALVHAIAPTAVAVSHEAESVDRSRPRPIENRIAGAPRLRTSYNSLAVNVPLGRQGLRLIVYAKEFDRVRFEIRYQGSLHSFLGRNPGSSGTVQGLLNRAIVDASRRMQPILDQLAQEPAVNDLRLSQFLILMARTTAALQGDAVRAWHILTLLAYDGGLSQTEDLTDDIGVLSQAGVIIRVRTRRRDVVPRFILEPRFSHVLQQIRALVDAGPQWAQPRRRVEP